MVKRPARGRALGASSSDDPETLGFIGVAAQRPIGLEEQVAFDRETERTTDGCDFREPDITEFGVADTEVTETEGEVGIVRIDLSQEPGGTGVGREELDDG